MGEWERTEEYKKKLSEARKGIVYSDETRNRMSLSAQNRDPSTRSQSLETCQKIRNSRLGVPSGMIGKKHSSETREKIKKSIKEWHSKFKGEFSYYESYGKEYIYLLRKSILERDDNTCQICGLQFSLTVHHIDYNKKNSVPSNLITLCRSCNVKANYNRLVYYNLCKSILEESWKYYTM